MRRPAEVERLYLDFDGFFASVEQQVKPHLRGKPIGIVPFKGATHTCVIACSREAKALGVQNVMTLEAAREVCPQLILVPQSPDLYRRAHNALLSEIETVIPVDAVKSIDELTCRLTPGEGIDPLAVGRSIKKRIADNIGAQITCSIGYAANRQLAKMACKAGKKIGGRYGDGNLIWHPRDMPEPLYALDLEDIPGVGQSMKFKLLQSGICTVEQLLATQPKHMRKLWRNVNGERLWYALQGYDIQTPPSGRSMYGHSRVLPPESRFIPEAREASRHLLTKAARRMRRDGWNAGNVSLFLQMRDEFAFSEMWLPAVHDDKAILAALGLLWADIRRRVPRRARIISLGVTLGELTRATERQLDLLLNDDFDRQRQERLTSAIDRLNMKHGRTLVSFGMWKPPPGGYAGGKISYTRIPSAEDFW
jgi:DNA polymerase IV